MSDMIPKPNLIINHTGIMIDKKKGRTFNWEFYKNNKLERFSVFEDKNKAITKLVIDELNVDFGAIGEIFVIEDEEEDKEELYESDEDIDADRNSADSLIDSIMSEFSDELEEDEIPKAGENTVKAEVKEETSGLEWGNDSNIDIKLKEEPMQVSFEEAWDSIGERPDLDYAVYENEKNRGESIGQVSDSFYNVSIGDRDGNDRYDLGTLIFDYILSKPAKGILAKYEYGESKLGIEFSIESGKVFNVEEREVISSDYTYLEGNAVQKVIYTGAHGENIEEIKSLDGNLLVRSYETDDVKIIVYVKSFGSFMMGAMKYMNIPYKEDIQENLKSKQLAKFKQSYLKTVNLPKIDYFKSFLRLDYVEKCDYQILDTENKLIDMCDELAKYPPEHIIGYDVESTGVKFHKYISPEKKDIVVTHSLSWKDDQSVIIPVRMRYTQNIKPHIANHYLKDVLEKRIILAHNGPFDARALIEEGIDLNLEEDTMTLAKFLFPYIKPELGMGLALDDLTKRVFNEDMIDLNKYVFKPAGIQFDFSILNELYMIYYGCPDTDRMRKLFKILRPKLEARQEQPYRSTVKFSKIMGIEATYPGIGVNLDAMLKEKHKSLDTVHRLEEIMYKLAGETKETLSLTSSQQLSNYIYGKMGAPITSETKRTEKGLSADKTVVEKLAKEKRQVPSNIFKADILDEEGEVLFKKEDLNNMKYPFCALLRKQADLNKDITAFFNGIINNSIDGIYHPEPKVARTDTFRTTERTQITKKGIKKYLGKYGPDWYVCSLDFAAEEFRLAANQSNDMQLIRMLQHEESDPHTTVAAELNGIEEFQVSKDLRGQTKAANFGIIYGMKAFRLACSIYRTEYPTEEQVKIAGDLYKLYCYKRRVMLAALDDARNFVRKNGFLYNKLGYKMIYEQVIDRDDYERQVFDPELKVPPTVKLDPDKHRENIGKLMTVSGNYPIQSWASGILIDGVVKFYDLLKKHGLIGRVHIPITVHDEVDLIAHKSVNQVLLLKLLKEAFESDLEYLHKETARLYVGIGFAYSWGDAKDDNREIPVALQNILVKEYDEGLHPEPIEIEEVQSYFENRINSYIVSRMRETLKDTFETKVYRTGEVEDKLSLDIFVGKKANELFKYINKDTNEYNHEKLLKIMCSYSDDVKPEDFTIEVTKSTLGEVAAEKEKNKVIDFFFTPVLHPRVYPAGNLLNVDITGLPKEITRNLIGYITSFKNNSDGNSKILSIKSADSIQTFEDIKILGLPIDAVDSINTILRGMNVTHEEKEKQRFNSDLASGDVLYFSGKSLIIDTELLEKFNMGHKLTDIVNVIAPSLSKNTSLEFELLLKSQESFKRTGYYLSGIPHNIYEEVNKVLI